MPTNPPALDALIAQLKSPDVVLASDVDPKVLAAGLEDMRNRLAHAEHTHLRAINASRAQEDRVTQLEQTTSSLEKDRDEFRKQVTTGTQLPIENQKKLTELEARVRTCEGAVGAAPYKTPKPISPDEHPAYDAPPPKNRPEPFPDPSHPPTTYNPENKAAGNLSSSSPPTDGSGGQAARF